MSEDDWDAVINVHLKGHFAPSQFACRVLARAVEGRAARRSAVASSTPRASRASSAMAGQANYSAAKAGIVVDDARARARDEEVRRHRQRGRAAGPHPHDRDGRRRRRVHGAKEGESTRGTRTTSRRWSCSSRRDDAADVTGQVFVVWGAHVYLMAGLAASRRRSIAASGRWTVEELIAPQGRALRAGAARQQDPARWASAVVESAPRGDAPRRPAALHGRPRTADEIAYRDLDAGTALTFARVGRAVEPARPLPRRRRASARATGSRSTCRATTACAGSSPTRRCTRPARSRSRPTPASRCRSSSTILGHAEVAAMHHRAPRCSTTCSRCARASRRCGIVVSADGDRPRRGRRLRRRAATDGSRHRRCRRRSTTWPTSCTRRARPACPKGVAVRHRNVAMMPNREPQLARRAAGCTARRCSRSPGIAFIYNPMKMGLAGLYLPKFDVDRWLDVVEQRAADDGVPRARDGRAASPRARASTTADLSQPADGVDRQRAARARDAAAAAGASCRTRPSPTPTGITEAGPAFIVMPKEEVTKRLGSVGKPMPPMELKIVDRETDDRVRRRATSASCSCRLPGKQREYYKDDDATASTWTADGWLRSGDLGVPRRRRLPLHRRAA